LQDRALTGRSGCSALQQREPAMEHFTLGPTPHNEDCAQVGTSEYAVRVRREGRAYISQLIRLFGAPPPGAEFRLKSFPHDFGTYHEVVVMFDPSVEAAVEFACKVEGALPGEWDEHARSALAADAQQTTG
jgi:hypothetical protein